MYFIQRVICLLYEIITIYTPWLSFQIIIIPYAPNLNNKYEKLTVDATLQQPWFYIFICKMFAFAEIICFSEKENYSSGSTKSFGNFETFLNGLKFEQWSI